MPNTPFVKKFANDFGTNLGEEFSKAHVPDPEPEKPKFNFKSKIKNVKPWQYGAGLGAFAVLGQGINAYENHRKSKLQKKSNTISQEDPPKKEMNPVDAQLADVGQDVATNFLNKLLTVRE